MISLDNIESHTIPAMGHYNIFGSPAELEAMPTTHQQQLFLLDPAANTYIYEMLGVMRLLSGGFWDPFKEKNFKEVETYVHFPAAEADRQAIKKWLYKRGIPFSRKVFVLPDGEENAVYTSWKMLLHYSPALFIATDIVVFDAGFNWCLVYFHEGKMFFGKNIHHDLTNDRLLMEYLNERKRKYPQYRHPYLP